MTFVEWQEKWSVPDTVGMVGDGWVPLLDRMMEDLAKVGPIGPIAQIKEKFGGLRFYVFNASEAHYEILLAAERESYNVCERCGAPGKLRSERRWWKTLCEPCTEAEKQ